MQERSTPIEKHLQSSLVVRKNKQQINLPWIQLFLAPQVWVPTHKSYCNASLMLGPVYTNQCCSNTISGALGAPSPQGQKLAAKHPSYRFGFPGHWASRPLLTVLITKCSWQACNLYRKMHLNPLDFRNSKAICWSHLFFLIRTPPTNTWVKWNRKKISSNFQSPSSEFCKLTLLNEVPPHRTINSPHSTKHCYFCLKFTIIIIIFFFNSCKKLPQTDGTSECRRKKGINILSSNNKNGSEAGLWALLYIEQLRQSLP